MMSPAGPRLPKRVEADPRHGQLLARLQSRTEKLWSGGDVEVPILPLEAPVVEALREARLTRRVVRGLDHAEARLDAERRGLSLADEASGVQRGGRVSRLLVLANDGAERFYRRVEALLRRNGPRVLALELDIDSSALGERVFGSDESAKLLMIEHKDAVSNVLLAIVGSSSAPGAATDIR